jgi:hypothetical protein
VHADAGVEGETLGAVQRPASGAPKRAGVKTSSYNIAPYAPQRPHTARAAIHEGNNAAMARSQETGSEVEGGGGITRNQLAAFRRHVKALASDKLALQQQLSSLQEKYEDAYERAEVCVCVRARACARRLVFVWWWRNSLSPWRDAASRGFADTRNTLQQTRVCALDTYTHTHTHTNTHTHTSYAPGSGQASRTAGRGASRT